jgi:Domain of unknown function (DUF1707)
MCHARHHYYREATRPIEEPPAHDPGLRASDAERESTVTLLRKHGTDGRLDVEELEQRVGAAYQARTHGDLAALLEDLPRAPAVTTPRRDRPIRHHGFGHGGHEWGMFARVSLLLVAIWAVTGAGVFWPAWVMAWWGLVLVLKTGPRLLRPR